MLLDPKIRALAQLPKMAAARHSPHRVDIRQTALELVSSPPQTASEKGQEGL